MSRLVSQKNLFFSLVLLLCVTAASSLSAQLPAPNFKSKSPFKSKLGQFGKAPSSSDDDPVALSSDFTVHAASRTGVLKVTAKIEKTWHIYSLTQAKGGPLATKVTIDPNDQLEIAGSFVPNPLPHVTESDLFSVPVEEHAGTVVWSVPVKFGPDVNTEELVIPVKVFYQVCSDSCLPPKTVKVESKFAGLVDEAPVLEDTPTETQPKTGDRAEQKKLSHKDHDTNVIEGALKPDVETPEQLTAMAKLYDADKKINWVPLYQKTKTTLFTALIGAFIGGFLLNLMPCVFPVLGIKVMGFVEQAGSSPGKIRLHGLVFTAGLLIAMWALAGFILALKNANQEVNWGQQMGSPLFVAAIIMILFLMGLNMAGVFEFGTSMTRLGGATQGGKGYTHSFVSGILTTLIATPCSGPFLGAAMGYTLSQDNVTAMILFTVLGLGIALPYLALSMFPALIKKLPRPGAWMETFKVSMGFLLFAAVAFFMRTFGGQTGIDGMSWLIMALVVVGLSAYFYGHWSQPHLPAKTRWIWGTALPLLILGCGSWMAYTASGYANTSVDHGKFRPWKPGIVEYYTSKEKRPVLVDYTASWCLTCQVNQRNFTNQFVKDRLAELGVLLVVADWTTYSETNPEVKDLARADRRSISTWLLYPPNYPAEPAIMLEEFITTNDVLEALDRIESSSGKPAAKTANVSSTVEDRH